MRPALALAIAAAGLALAACERKAPSSSSTTPAASGIPGVRIVAAPADPDQTYTVRGRIYNIPSGSPTEELMIAHEAIPGFVNRNGQIVGMNAMIMPFPAFDPGVDTRGLGEGDKVEFTFAVDWDGDPRWVVTALTRLEPTTPMALEGVWPDTPPAPAPDAAPGDPGAPD